MLAVLSELGTLKYLNSKGVYPDLYSNDFIAFKDTVAMQAEVDVIIITCSAPKFPRTKFKQFLLALKDIEDQENSNIKSLTILSNYQLSYIDRYYFFEDSFRRTLEASHWINDKSKLRQVDILAQYKGEPKESQMQLRDSVTYDIPKDETEDKLKSLIKGDHLK